MSNKNVQDPVSLDELAADSAAQAESQRSQAPLSLQEIVMLAERQVQLEDEVEALEAQLELRKSELREVAENKLPKYLADAGLTGLPLRGGLQVEIVESVQVGIPPETRDAAHAWLREQGLGDVIKRVVSVSFGKGEDADANRLLEHIRNREVAGDLRNGGVSNEEKVHPSTLKSLIRERLREGQAVPTALFKLFVGNVAKIKRPRERRLV